MPLSIETVTAPTGLPVSLSEAMTHLRYEGVEDKPLITSLVRAAVDHAQAFTGRQLMTATYKLRLASCEIPAGDIVLPHAPLQSVSAVEYVDAAGANQTLSTSLYTVHRHGDPGRIRPAYGQQWPTVRDQRDAMTVTFVAGYASASLVPASIRQAILMLAAHWYEHREAAVDGPAPGPVVMGAQSLMWQHKVFYGELFCLQEPCATGWSCSSP